MTEPASAIDSPCIRNCCLDKQDVCIGCGRTVQEIVHWGDAGAAEKQTILLAAKQRLAERKRAFD